MTLRFARLAVVTALTALLGRSPARAEASSVVPPTVPALQAAYQSDLHAQARYLAFALRAEQDGYRGVARLFRAAARSEEVRAGSHAAALRQLGARPAAPTTASISVQDTRQNLVATLAHENAERSGAYPRLARRARTDAAPDAALSFTLAHGAETGLVRLYQEALANLERMRAPGEPLLVCATCGHVERGAAPERCPICLSARDAFSRVD